MNKFTVKQIAQKYGVSKAAIHLQIISGNIEAEDYSCLKIIPMNEKNILFFNTHQWRKKKIV